MRKAVTWPQLCGRCFYKPNKNIISSSSRAAEDLIGNPVCARGRERLNGQIILSKEIFAQ